MVSHQGDGEIMGWIPNYPMRATEDPRQLPELRAALIDFAQPGRMWETSEVQRCILALSSATKGYGQKELQEVVEAAIQAGQNQVYWYRRLLPDTQLVHVSAEMVEVVESAAISVPEDYVLKQSDMPTPCGFVVFATPMWGKGYQDPMEHRALDEQDKIEMVDIRVDAIMWAPVRLPPGRVSKMFWRDEDIEEEGRMSVGIAAFRLVAPGMTDPFATSFYGDPRMQQRPMWMPLGRTDWPLGEPLNLPTHDSLGHNLWETMMDDRRKALTLWSVMQQKLLVERTTVEADRHAKRRLQRAGHKHSPVQVIHLRRKEYRPTGDQADVPGGRHVSVRFPVRPFTRIQHYGKGNAQTKLIVVPPHWRGPVDGPVVHTERIWSVDR
jgi:hypothetical protein